MTTFSAPGRSRSRLVLFAVLVVVAVSGQADRYRPLREAMVRNELEREGIRSKAVLDSMRQVPRHLFVTPEYRANAYLDCALPIGKSQTISPPFIVAYMTESLDPQPEDKVLEIGTGSGFQAAVLSNIVKDVYTIEIVPELGEHATQVLKEQGYKNVHTMVGDGYKGWPMYAPFDKIIVTCSPEKIPEPLVEQLKEGGKMIIPLGERYEQVFYMLEKKNGKLEKQRMLPAMFVPMTGIAEAGREVKPDPAKPTIRNGGFEIDDDKDGYASGWYYQRQVKLASKEAPEGGAYITFENSSSGRGAQVLQATGCDGAKVGALDVKLMVKGTNLKHGVKKDERPGLVVHFFDADRQPVGQEVLGGWRGTFGWRKVQGTLHVPPKAKEAIIRVGLNGGTGILSVDDIQMTASPR